MHPTSSGTCPRWLVVDDDPTFVASVVSVLRQAGHAGDGVGTAAAALQALASATYAAVIVDLHLPGGAGLLQRLHADAPQTRVVTTTERYDSEEAAEALWLGAAEVLEKPLTDDVLRDVAARVLDAAAAPAQQRRPAAVARGRGSAAARGDAAQARPHRPAPEARRRILVVDDDLLVGKFIGLVLKDFEVVFAQSAAGALGRVASNRGFAAVVCDLHMPGMDGMRLHEEIARLDPALGRRMVFVTGWSEAPAFAEFRRRTRCAWLAKPFDPAALRAAVDGACAADAVALD